MSQKTDITDFFALHVGCGNNYLSDFINIDLYGDVDIIHDIREGLPFENQSADVIYSEHFIEHLTREEGIRFLRECRRVIKNDGTIRISTPDLKIAAVDYLNGDLSREWLEKYGYGWIESPAEMLNISMREWGHLWVYDQQELCRSAQLVGLQVYKICEFQKSDTEVLQNIDSRPDSLIIEFKKKQYDFQEDPLVSILIPAYKAKFFEESLLSAIHQTYQNKEIIVSDDSHDSKILQIVQKYLDQNQPITYIKNKIAYGGVENYNFLFSIAQGDYIKFLNDDDILEADCVEVLANILTQYPSVTLATSHRIVINSQGNNLGDFPFNTKPIESSGIINGSYSLSILAESYVNYIGEPSTVMFRAADMKVFGDNLFSVCGYTVPWNVDMGMWQKLLSLGDFAYVTRSLSKFRRHPQQEQALQKDSELLRRSYEILSRQAYRLGFEKLMDTEIQAFAIGDV